MRRISSRATFFYKWLFPIVFFGGLAAFAGTSLLTLPDGRSPFLPFVILPALMAVFGYFLMKKLIFDLVDEVWDDGTSLIIRNRGEQDRVPLSNIMNVSYSPLINPPRVTLMLRQPSNFGAEISFSAPTRFVPFGKSPMIEDLIRRVDAARRK